MIKGPGSRPLSVARAGITKNLSAEIRNRFLRRSKRRGFSQELNLILFSGFSEQGQEQEKGSSPSLGKVGPVSHDHSAQHHVVLGEVTVEQIGGSYHGHSKHVGHLHGHRATSYWHRRDGFLLKSKMGKFFDIVPHRHGLSQPRVAWHHSGSGGKKSRSRWESRTVRASQLWRLLAPPTGGL